MSASETFLASRRAVRPLAGLELVEHNEHNVRRHNEIMEQFANNLGRPPGIRFQEVRKEDCSTYKDFSILISHIAS